MAGIFYNEQNVLFQEELPAGMSNEEMGVLGGGDAGTALLPGPTIIGISLPPKGFAPLLLQKWKRLLMTRKHLKHRSLTLLHLQNH